MSNDIASWLEDLGDVNSREDGAEDSKKKTYENDMFKELLPALDKGNKKFFLSRTAEQQAEIAKSMWVLMGFMSSSKNLPEHHLMMVNDLVNSDFNLLVKKVQSNRPGHPALQWMLLALCGSGEKQYHERIPAPKGLKKSKLEEAVLNHYPLLKDDDLELLLKINGSEDLSDFFKQNGYDDKTIKELLKSDAKSK